MHSPRPESLTRRLLRDSAYVLPGLPIALFGASLLMTLLAVSIATAPLWVGALVLPLALVTASEFAELSRRRLRIWGAVLAPVSYRPRDPGLAGRLRPVADPRRWLDLIFEMILALPVRLVTFVVAALWILMGPVGLTYFFWSRFIPGERGLIRILELIEPALVPASGFWQYVLDAAVFFILGVVFLVTLPAVMRGLAALDALLATSLLGAGGRGRLIPLEHPQAHPLERTLSRAAVGRPGARVEESSASFSAAAWSWIGICFAAVVLFVVAWPLTTTVYGIHPAFALVLTLGHCLSLVLTLKFPWAGIGASVLVSAALMGATAEAGVGIWPWPVTAMLIQCGVILVAALREPWYCAASGWAASALLTFAAIVMAAPELPDGAVSTGIVFASVGGGVAVLGSLTRQWIRDADRLEVSERTSAQQSRRRRELEERNRIARELHDVVAHSMSVISVQAATARYRLPSITPEAQQEFEEIARSSRQALGEMRMLLGTLRSEEEAPTGPTPGLAEIYSLVEATRASGTPIRVTGLDVVEASSAVGLAAYRMVQEGLSNALRHAPSSTIEVSAELIGESDKDSEPADTRHLLIQVRNTAPPHPVSVPAPGAGLGLEGIRERVSAVGGTVETGETPDGGYFIRASFPL
ncbi:sensor domain-containing protein [Nesterenkonia sp. LB17]|uniref:sensor histidine kinase n=1 Tax=unclassified Nesterenkonia TaxID=2629769 RepID=UPI001F4CCC83|nr:sensor domain-containing protein [Nesterenkonia sp. YGD6]MCH8565927.1 sensor domain-containing protein [Nesterenkonia sp. LB17]MCH8570719.1 sensor domain-containing protein [Nesterenkonia sp. AY15]